LTDKEDFDEKFLESVAQKNAMVSGTFKKAGNSNLTRNELDKKGLIAGHAYSILRVRKVFNKRTGEMVNLIKLRNPWGQKEWR
jgi:hypothetical protein